MTRQGLEPRTFRLYTYLKFLTFKKNRYSAPEAPRDLIQSLN